MTQLFTNNFFKLTAFEIFGGCIERKMEYQKYLNDA